MSNEQILNGSAENGVELNDEIENFSDESSKSEVQPEVAAVPGSQNGNDSVDQEINLQVGERRFRTTSKTLRGSDYFDGLLHKRLRADNRRVRLMDVDRDGDLFEHILRYLRSGVLPIFHDQVKGHDEVLYRALLAEAKFFGIERLRNWLEQKKYQEAIEVTYPSSVKERICEDGKLGWNQRSDLADIGSCVVTSIGPRREGTVIGLGKCIGEDQKDHINNDD